MPSIVADLSKSIADKIQGGDFTQDFTVFQAWTETESREKLLESSPITVAVMPVTLDVTAFDLLPRVAIDWKVGIWIEKAVEPTYESIDAVAEFMEQVVLLLTKNRVIALGDRQAKCIGMEAQPAYDPQKLLDMRVFRSVILLTYRVTQ